MKRSPSTTRLWLAVNFVGLLLVGFVYYAVQQNERQSANDPQIQLAEDAAAALDNGQTPQSVMPATTTDITSSLAPFVMVLDKNGRVLAGSGQLDGQTAPAPPAGALQAAATGHGKDTSRPHENRITWEPGGGVRDAAVIVANHGGYVVVARSLREVETRENTLSLVAVAAAIVLLLGTSIIFWLG